MGPPPTSPTARTSAPTSSICTTRRWPAPRRPGPAHCRARHTEAERASPRPPCRPVGLTHFEGRTWRGWHHQVSLFSVAHAFSALLDLIHFDGYSRSGVLPREDVHHGEHGEEEASPSSLVHAGVQARDRRAVPRR
ncbi:hypothetical protein C6376_39755 [Streptomyces sp. P3]|nr:hypothetical protein C6376_39755 [Streptomyces sp. P3]